MNLEKIISFEPAAGAVVGMRLDLFLTERMPSMSRTKLSAMIKNGEVLVNKQSSKSGYRLRETDAVQVFLAPETPSRIQPEAIPLEVLYEDEYLLAVNKQAGIVVHPGAGIPQGTLVNALLHYTRELSSVGGADRPGLVHRLDKDTSGVLIVAKSNEAHWKLSRLFANRQVDKQYRAIVYGVPEGKEGLIDAPIRRSQHNRQIFKVEGTGRPARSRYIVLQDFRIMAYLAVTLETGRTHQARVHLQSIGHPVVGDPVYGGGVRKGTSVASQDVALLKRVQAAVKRQMLHAHTIRFRHPFTEQQMEIVAPLPADFSGILSILESRLITG